MKQNFLTASVILAAAGSAAAQSLYHPGIEALVSSPLKFTVGAQLIYDDNVAPGEATKESSLGFNPYVGASLIAISPQTTWNAYVRLGLVYLFDAPPQIDDVTSQSRAGVNFTHRFSERLRFTSENFLSYELEPDFANGIGASRRLGPFISLSTNNSIGYRWTERFGNYVGFILNSLQYDVPSNDRFTWELYNQFRYQIGTQTVLTGDYRYSQTDATDAASASTNQFLLVGAEQRFSPNTIGIARCGIQLRDVNDGDSSTSPYMELALNTAVNQVFSLRAFTRYGLESADTVRSVPNFRQVEFDERQTLRVGIAGDYVLSQALSLFGGIDYIPSTFAGGRNTDPLTPYTGGDLQEDIFNAFIGLSLKVTDTVTANVTYNFTDSSSDFENQTFQRNRISIGVSAPF